MAFPAGGNKLQLVAHQDSDGALVETYTIPGLPYQHQLGAGSIPSFPVLPTGWQLLVKGAFPLTAPAAPTALATVSGAGNFLVPSTVYKWVVTHLTDYGETVAGAILSVTLGAGGGAGATGYHMTLPALNGTASNPVRRRRIWRTVSGGAGSFFLVEEIGTTQTDYTDWRADTSLDTSTTAPVVNTSGATAITSLKINGVEKVASEVGSAPGVAGAWSCDYTYGPSAGQITHAAADTGLTVIATYTAAIELNAQLFNDLITAIKEIDTAAGAASGLADLDAGGHVPLARLSGLTTAQLSATAGIVNGQIASLDGSKITSGIIPVAAIANLTSADMAGSGTSGGFGGASGFAALDASSRLTATATAGGLTITGPATLGAHVASTGSAPTIAAGSGAGAGASVAWTSATGTDRRGTVTVTTGPGAIYSARQAVVTFATPYATVPTVVLNGGPGLQADTITTTGFEVWCVQAVNPPSSSAYRFNYIVEQ